MCLAVPLTVIEVLEKRRVRVEDRGVSFVATSTLVSELQVGDKVLVHAGFVIGRVSEEEARKSSEAFDAYFAALLDEEGK